MGSLFKTGSESSSTLLSCFTTHALSLLWEFFHLYFDKRMRSSVVDIKFSLNIKFDKSLLYSNAVI